MTGVLWKTAGMAAVIAGGAAALLQVQQDVGGQLSAAALPAPDPQRPGADEFGGDPFAGADPTSADPNAAGPLDAGPLDAWGDPLPPAAEDGPFFTDTPPAADRSVGDRSVGDPDFPPFDANVDAGTDAGADAFDLAPEPDRTAAALQTGAWEPQPGDDPKPLPRRVDEPPLGESPADEPADFGLSPDAGAAGFAESEPLIPEGYAPGPFDPAAVDDDATDPLAPDPLAPDGGDDFPADPFAADWDADPAPETEPTPTADIDPAASDAEFGGFGGFGMTDGDAASDGSPAAIRPDPTPDDPTPDDIDPVELPPLDPPAATDDRDAAPVRRRPRNAAAGRDEPAGDSPAASGSASLAVRKVAPETAVLGEPMVYEIRLENPGPDAARGVVVEEAVPRGVDLDGTIPRAELVDGVLAWTFDSIPAGGSELIRVRVVPRERRFFGSTTVVRLDCAVAAATEVVGPRLELSLDAPARLRSGEEVALDFTVANHGTGPARGVWLRSVLPPELTHASGLRDIEYEVGDVPAGSTVPVRLVLTATGSGAVRCASELLTAAGVADDATADFELVGRQLALTRSGPKARFTGREAIYRNRLTNTSAVPSAPSRLVERVPEGMAFVKAGSGGTFDPATREVVWDVPAIAPEASTEFGVVLQATAPGTAESTVRVVEPGGLESALTSRTEVRGYASTTAGLRGAGGPLAVGERVAVTVELSNRGTEPAADLRAVLDVPAGVKLVAVRGDLRREDGSDGTGGLRFAALSELAPGETRGATVVLEGVSAGTAEMTLTVESADLPTPLKRSEPLRVLGAN